jgi:glucosamine-phosphate N-acetyltransferase
MIIREFQKDDINKGLIETYKEVWWITDITDESLKKYLSNNNYMVVCEENDVIIGTATLHIQHKLIRDGGIAGLIEDVAVREEFRGKNIGSELIQHLIDKSKELGCYKVILSCFPERINFYEKNGFSNESITMRHNLK